jgi:hypothetical protein
VRQVEERNEALIIEKVGDDGRNGSTRAGVAGAGCSFETVCAMPIHFVHKILRAFG